MRAPTSELTRVGNVLKLMHVEHCSLTHTVRHRKTRTGSEKMCCLASLQRYSMSADPVSSHLQRKAEKHKIKLKNKVTLSVPNQIMPEFQARYCGRNG